MDGNWTYCRNVNDDLVKVFYSDVISRVGGIFQGGRVISTTDFEEGYNAILIPAGKDVIFLTSRWWEVIEGDASLYYVEGLAIMQSPKPFSLRPVNWPEKEGWKFLIGHKEGFDTGWRKN